MVSLFRTIFLFILAVTFSTAAAEEGLVIENKSTTGAMGMGGDKTQMIDFIAGNKFRSEEQLEPYGIFRLDPECSKKNTVSIKLYESLAGWDIDLLTKTYVETDLNPTPDVSDVPIDTGFVSFSFPRDTLIKKFACRTTLDSSSVIDTINGYPCYKISLNTCCINPDIDSVLLTTDIWICNDFPGMDIYRNYQAGQRRSFGVPDTADMAKVNLDEEPAINEMLKFHAKVLTRKSLVYNSIVIKSDLNWKFMVWRPKNLSDSSAADSSGFLEDVSEKFSAYAFAIFQKLFGSGQDKLFMNIISLSYEVTDIQLRDLPDSLFVLPEGLTLKEETAAE